jgi:hypothetical protein
LCLRMLGMLLAAEPLKAPGEASTGSAAVWPAWPGVMPLDQLARSLPSLVTAAAAAAPGDDSFKPVCEGPSSVVTCCLPNVDPAAKGAAVHAEGCCCCSKAGAALGLCAPCASAVGACWLHSVCHVCSSVRGADVTWTSLPLPAPAVLSAAGCGSRLGPVAADWWLLTASLLVLATLAAGGGIAVSTGVAPGCWTEATAAGATAAGCVVGCCCLSITCPASTPPACCLTSASTA